ncbi:serine/threonine/tyrosine-interacting protein A-like [Babylonia areolata]|uniref:serine/threonine/tyrosine-interacting protein A-like n=1 Tax=Babylonia areolata TaxID=304850 RepID=UPI003FD3697E
MDGEKAFKLRLYKMPEEEIPWEYNKRREMQEIIPGLFLGPYSAACKSELGSLTSAGITHIVCVRQRMLTSLVKPNFPEVFTYLVLDIEDNEVQNIMQYFPKVNDFILTCLKAGGKCLVHGTTGCSRSATLVQAFIMRHFDRSCSDVSEYIQKRRFCICPNMNFTRQLEDYAPICKAYHTTLAPADQQRGSVKRKWEAESSSDMDWNNAS